MNDQDEQLIIVDEKDNILDYQPRNIVHQQKLLHRTISVSIYNNKGQILLHKRSAKKDNNAGFWANSVGGHVTKDKNYNQTAQEEITEELDINPNLTLIKKMKINDPAHTSMTCIYKAFSDGPFNFNKEEIDEIKFFSKEEIKNIKDKLSESAKIVLREQGLL